MDSLLHKFLFDASIPLWGFVFGSIFGVLAFIITVLVEAALMKRFFSDLSFKRCSWYSLLVNLLSSLLGMPIAYLFSNTTTHTFNTILDFFAELFMIFVTLSLYSPKFIISVMGWWLVLAFVITLISEFVFFKYFLKSKSIQEIVKFTVVANLASYAITTVLAFVAPFFLFLYTQIF